MWYWYLISFLGIVAICYYVVVGLSYIDILWTRIEQGWIKIKLHNGKYKKSLLPGRRWLGLPGVDTLYRRKMKFLEGILKEDGTVTVIAHADPNIESFKSTSYPYALPFKDEEDNHGLPLSGVMVVNGHMADAKKMFFGPSDWYTTIVMLALSCFREVITTVSYEEITGQEESVTNKSKFKRIFASLLWQEMNAPREGGKLSVVDELLEIDGFEVESVELATIDPPADWRATTLAPYKAKKDAEAAKLQAQASASLFDDTNQALKAWREDHQDATPSQIEAKQEELSQRALAKTQSYQQVHIKGLENASTAVVGGGTGTGIMVGGNQGQGRGQQRRNPRGDKATRRDEFLDNLRKEVEENK